VIGRWARPSSLRIRRHPQTQLSFRLSPPDSCDRPAPKCPIPSAHSCGYAKLNFIGCNWAAPIGAVSPHMCRPAPFPFCSLRTCSAEAITVFSEHIFEAVCHLTPVTDYHTSSTLPDRSRRWEFRDPPPASPMRRAKLSHTSLSSINCRTRSVPQFRALRERRRERRCTVLPRASHYQSLPP
jgi:hypothetical protein